MKVNYPSCELDLKIDGREVPGGVSITDFVLREFTLYAVPMLDLVFLDALDSLNYQNCTIKDGTIINVIMTYYKGKDEEYVRTMDFRVCKITPTIPITGKISTSVSNITYHLSCLLNSNLVLRDTNFSYIGTYQNCFEKIFNADTPDATLITDFTDEYVHTFLKPKTESFARYLKKLVLSISNGDSRSYYGYFHDGNNVYILDLLAILRGNGDVDDYSSFTITEDNFLKMEVYVDSYTQARRNGSYGCTVHQYDFDTGSPISSSSANTYIASNQCTIDTKTKEDAAILASGNMGNHTKNYVENYLNNIRNYGIFSFKAWFRFSFPTKTLGLQCVKLKYKNSEPIPFLVMGRETRLKNNHYTEDLLLYSNTMNTDIATMFAKAPDQ